ncbi:hypothetical protein LCM19_02190 [Qipengyuania flava]|nr:hypothetical protein [Qipengyuania flava]
MIEAAIRAGLEVVAVGNATDLSDLPCTVPRILLENPINPLQVVRALVDYGVEYGDDRSVCVGLGDDSSESACLVNAALGLAAGRYASFTSLETMRNKYRLRGHLGSQSRLNGRYCLLRQIDKAVEILETAPHGVVVKPLDGSGSRGVTRISGPHGSYPITGPGERLMVEECFDGPEFSVESITWNGVHYPLIVTEKKLGGETGLVEIGQRQPARLDPDDVANLFGAAAEVLTSVGYRYGLSHIEFILQSCQPKLVEAHGRVGGDMIADLMQWSIGINGFAVLFRAYKDNAVTPASLTGIEAGIEFVDLKRWEGSDAEWLERIHAMDGVVDARVLRDRTRRSLILSSSDRHAQVIVAGEAIDNTIQQIHNMEQPHAHPRNDDPDRTLQTCQ